MRVPKCFLEHFLIGAKFQANIPSHSRVLVQGELQKLTFPLMMKNQGTLRIVWPWYWAQGNLNLRANIYFDFRFGSLIRQKANLKTGVSRKQNTPNFPKNEHFLPSDTHMYVCVSGVKKCSFFVKFGVLYFLQSPVLIFTLLAY